MTNYIRSYWTQRAAKAALITSIALSLAASDARGTTRYWQGTAGNNWSTPANWSPTGPPQNADDLVFANRVSYNIVNDLPSLKVRSLDFQLSFTVSGNSLAIENSISSEATDSSVSLDVSGLTLLGNISISCDSQDLYFNCPIDLVDYDIIAYTHNNRYLWFASTLSGTGEFAAAGGNIFLYPFNGNPFAGTFVVQNATLYLDSLNGGSVRTRLEIWFGGTVSLSKSFQIDGGVPVVFMEATAQLLLNGNTNWFSDVEMRGGLLDSGPAGMSYLAGELQATSGYSQVAGNLSLYDAATPPAEFSVTSSSNPALDLAANVSGTDLTKTGSGFMRLLGNNTFTGNLQIDAGTVQPTSAAALSPSSAGVILNGGNLQMQGLTIGNEPLYVNSPNSTLIAYDACSWSGSVTLNADFNVLPADTTSTGKAMNFTGPISGSGGVTMLDSPSYNGTLLLSGSSANT